MEEDILWKQRFQNFNKAFSKLQDAVQSFESKDLSDLEKEGLIQRFEYTHELAWNVMKDFFEFEGNTTIMGSRSATREAFSKGIIKDGDIWMDIIKSRNLTTHTYNEHIAEDIVDKIIRLYYSSFKVFQLKMSTFLI